MNVAKSARRPQGRHALPLSGSSPRATPAPRAGTTPPSRRSALPSSSRAASSSVGATSAAVGGTINPSGAHHDLVGRVRDDDVVRHANVVAERRLGHDRPERLGHPQRAAAGDDLPLPRRRLELARDGERSGRDVRHRRATGGRHGPGADRLAVARRREGDRHRQPARPRDDGVVRVRRDSELRPADDAGRRRERFHRHSVRGRDPWARPGNADVLPARRRLGRGQRQAGRGQELRDAVRERPRTEVHDRRDAGA